MAKEYTAVHAVGNTDANGPYEPGETIPAEHLSAAQTKRLLDLGAIETKADRDTHAEDERRDTLTPVATSPLATEPVGEPALTPPAPTAAKK